MKNFIIALISFILGVVLSGVFGYILAAQIFYDITIEKLDYDVGYYRLIEQGKPELIQMEISSSLDYTINAAEDLENYFWVSPAGYHRLTLIKAKELQEQILLEKGNK